uniref:Protein Wnt n=1 Tax=Dendrocoelum lacteum TaxID=27895 RepID=T1DBK4_9PLAT
MILNSKMRMVYILMQCISFLITYSCQTHWLVKTLPLPINNIVHNNDMRKICAVISSEFSKEKTLCLSYPEMMLSIIYGAKIGLGECGEQFKFERWNCTFNYSYPDKTLRNLHEITSRNIKETAFLYSIWSSGVVYSITNSCSKGHLKECYCDPKRHGQDKDSVGDFTWGGCSDHIKFGMKVGRIFLDNYSHKSIDGAVLANLHNNRVGRRIVWKTRLKKCKCHGVSGACSLRTCWQRMNDFKVIGETLKKMYQKSQKVSYNPFQKDLILDRNPFRRPSKRKLVYFNDSPDFCTEDLIIGHPGTGGRECNDTSKEHDSCSDLCCNRGHHTYEMIVEENCDCKFFWCCEVRCKICRRKKFVYRCRHPVR